MADRIECRLHDAIVPLRGYRLDHAKRDVAYEILVDFFSEEAQPEFRLWTTIASWMRVKIGAGAYSAVGDSLATSVDLGAFAAGEIKEGTIEITAPAAADVRHQELALNLSLGILIPLWNISGAIRNSGGVGISGVTVDLSGDATDSTTTEEDGSYIFSNLADGDYTITPTFTLTNHTISPLSRDETVANNHVVNSDFTSYFQFERTFNDDTIGQAPSAGVTMWQDDPTDVLSFLVSAWFDGDTENWTPSGFSKCLEIQLNKYQSDGGAIFDLGAAIPTDVDLNFEFLMTVHDHANDGFRGSLAYSMLKDSGGDLTDNTLIGHYSTYEWLLRAFGRTGGGNVTIGSANVDGGDFFELQDWIKFRITVTASGALTGTFVDASSGLVRATLNGSVPSWGAYDPMNYLKGNFGNAVSNDQGWIYIARAYIGDASLGWPSDA